MHITMSIPVNLAPPRAPTITSEVPSLTPNYHISFASQSRIYWGIFLFLLLLLATHYVHEKSKLLPQNPRKHE